MFCIIRTLQQAYLDKVCPFFANHGITHSYVYFKHLETEALMPLFRTKYSKHKNALDSVFNQEKNTEAVHGIIK